MIHYIRQVSLNNYKLHNKCGTICCFKTAIAHRSLELVGQWTESTWCQRKKKKRAHKVNSYMFIWHRVFNIFKQYALLNKWSYNQIKDTSLASHNCIIRCTRKTAVLHYIIISLVMNDFTNLPCPAYKNFYEFSLHHGCSVFSMFATLNTIPTLLGSRIQHTKMISSA